VEVQTLRHEWAASIGSDLNDSELYSGILAERCHNTASI
jgi:hypothetical protein